MENNNHIIEEQIYMTQHYHNARNLIIDISGFIGEVAYGHAVSIFQSGFGFMGSNNPFTMLIHHTKKYETDSIDCEHDFSIYLWVTNYCEFRIQDDNSFPRGYWKLNCQTTKDAIPNWKEMTPLQIMTEKPISDFTDFKSCDCTDSLFNTLHDLLFDEYIHKDERYASDYLECHVACIYTED